MKQADILKSVQEVGGNQFDFDEFYARCWSEKRGGISFKLANNLINYLKEKNLAVGSVLDVCSGSGEFISNLRNICTDCVGIDTADGFISYAKRKCSDVEFIKVDRLHEFNLKRKFDLISCNGDVVNMFTLFDNWKTFFEVVNNHLSKNGLFLFDFYTKEYLDSLSGLVYDESENIDYVSKRTQNNGLCVMSEIYYLKESSMYYRKTGDVMVETSFKIEDILNLLKATGFIDVKLVGVDLKELTLDDLKVATRIHVLARKK